MMAQPTATDGPRSLVDDRFWRLSRHLDGSFLLLLVRQGCVWGGGQMLSHWVRVTTKETTEHVRMDCVMIVDLFVTETIAFWVPDADDTSCFAPQRHL